MTKYEQLRGYMAAKPCGTRGKYVAGCRCVKCRAANSAYQCERERKLKAGKSNPLVDASPAREHIRALSRHGIGYKTVSHYAGVGNSTLFQIMSGRRLKVRRLTLEAVLAVDRRCFTGGTLLPASETLRRIAWLKSEGFTERQIAKRMGLRTPHLQINRRRVTGRTASRIERIYRIARLGE